MLKAFSIKWDNPVMLNKWKQKQANNLSLLFLKSVGNLQSKVAGILGRNFINWWSIAQRHLWGWYTSYYITFVSISVICFFCQLTNIDLLYLLFMPPKQANGYKLEFIQKKSSQLTNIPIYCQKYRWERFRRKSGKVT